MRADLPPCKQRPARVGGLPGRQSRAGYNNAGTRAQCDFRDDVTVFASRTGPHIREVAEPPTRPGGAEAGTAHWPLCNPQPTRSATQCPGATRRLQVSLAAPWAGYSLTADRVTFRPILHVQIPTLALLDRKIAMAPSRALLLATVVAALAGGVGAQVCAPLADVLECISTTDLV